MIIRSVRKLFFLSCLAFLLLAAWHRSPWTTTNVYEHLSLFRDSDQTPIPNGYDSGIRKETWSGSRLSSPKLVAPEPVADGMASTDPQELLQEKKVTPPWITKSSSSKGNASVPQDAPSWPQDMKEYMKSMLKWDRPSWLGHWPAFEDYVDKDYDPNRWEQFPM